MVHRCFGGWLVRRQSAASVAKQTIAPGVLHRDMDQKISGKHTDVEPSVRNWVIEKSSLGGRGVFASKKIQRGSLIFENRPLVVAPRADTVNKTYCIVCYKLHDTCYMCDKCRLLMCSEQCESSSNHEVLCAFIANNWTPKPKCDGNTEITNSAVILLRFMLLEDERKYLLELLQKSKIYFKDCELETLSSTWNIPEGQLRFMSLVNSVIKINSFRISCNPQDKTVPLRGLYPLSSFMNHRCVPNTRNIFKKDYSMAVYASKDIDVGEEIVTSYTGLLWSTPARRCQLYKTKKFWCKCKRCEDRTEMNTILSALKCLDKVCVGVLLPDSATDPGTEWKCDNCHTKVDSSKIRAIQSVLGSLVGTLDLDDKFRLETLVLEKLAKFVPYSSHIFVDLRLRLALRIGFTGLKLNGIYNINSVLWLLITVSGNVFNN